MNDKERVETILEGIKRKMQQCTTAIQRVDEELDWLQQVQVNDTVLDSIRETEYKLQAIHADRNALWVKYRNLSRKLENL